MTALLAYEMKTRGSDATGILTVDPKGRWKLRKKPVPADVFIAGRQGIGVSAQTLLLHTRAATQGKPSIAGNNHPIQHGGIIGIHNGIVWNDDALFKHYGWPRQAEVDSEAIFAALNYLPQAEALTRIDGGWAIAWVDTDVDPRKLWLARGSSSPLHYATTQNGSLVFASTFTAVREAFEYGGINGKPDIQTAKEGFLASVHPDTGLIIEPEFDGSGKDAPGARPPRVYVSTGGIGHTTQYGSGYSWDDEETWQTASERFKGVSTTPGVGVRQWVKGDPKDARVGDVRKYRSAKGDWTYESCTFVGGTGAASWVTLHGSRVEDAKRLEHSEPLAELVRAPVSVSINGREIPIDQNVIDPFDDPQEVESDPEVVLGFAGVGDLIGIPKHLFTHNGRDENSMIAGTVIDYDEGTKELIVDWRQGRINLFAEYHVLWKAQKGVNRR